MAEVVQTIKIPPHERQESVFLHSQYHGSWWLDNTSSQDISNNGPHLNIKTAFPRYGDSHVKDKTVGETVLSLTWKSLYR